MTAILFLIVGAVFVGVGVANQHDRAHGKRSPPRNYDGLLPDADPPVAAPFPGEHTGS